MKQIRAESLLGLTSKVMLASVLGISSCALNQSQPSTSDKPDTLATIEKPSTPVPPLPATQENFDDFLKYFRSNETYKHWPEAAQFKLLDNEDFFKDHKDFELVKTIMREVPKEYAAFFPVEPLKSVDSLYPIKDPIDSFRFFAFEKIEFNQFWLLSVFAFKTPYKQTEYHEHQFFLSTMSKEGRRIQDFLWWGIINDDVQIPNRTSAVWGDTIVAGHMGRIDLRVFNDIFLKVMLRSTGRFDTIYYNPPEPSTF